MAAVNRSGEHGFLGGMLFLTVLLFYTITLTPFIDLTASATVDPAVDQSNALNQIVFLAITATLILAALRLGMTPLLVQPRWLILATVLWFALVSLISAHPDVALKRVVLAILTVVDAGIFLGLVRSERQFATLMTVGVLVTLIVAYLGVALVPRLAIHQASELREPMNAGFWRGHYAHKNAAAAAMVLYALVGLYLYGIGRRAVGALIVGLAVVFLAHTGGKTAMGSLPAIVAVAWVFERVPALRPVIVIGGIVAINALTIGCSVSPALRDAVASLGIDATFTNRTDIWQVGTGAVGQRPLTGYGFQLFWQTDELVYSAGGGTNWAVAAFNGHNAYLDAAVTTGLPGLALTLAWLVVSPLRDIRRIEEGDNDPCLTRLFLRIWLYGVFSACVESLFFQSGSLIWFAFVFSVFGLRLQAQARLIGLEPEPRAVGATAHA